MVKTRFCVDSKCVWVRESPVPLTKKEIDRTVKMLDEEGYGVVDNIEVIKSSKHG